MNKDFFDDYINARCCFEKKIKEFDSLKTFAKTKLGSKYCPDSIIYNIRGTRYYLVVKKVYWPAGIGEFVTVKVYWQYKIKNTKTYKKTSLDEILDSDLISNRAKEEIIFNLNVFLT